MSAFRRAWSNKRIVFGLALVPALATSVHASVRPDSLAVSVPRHAIESTRISSTRTFVIAARGFANRAEDLYVFEEGASGCSDLQRELEYSQDAQERYYRLGVHGQFARRTVWDAFQDAGKHWACVYLASRAGREVQHRFASFMIAAPPVGRLDVHPPAHPSAGQRYAIALTGFAARTDSLWIYLQRRVSRPCVGWYAFYDSTYAHAHRAYERFIVHGHFSKRARWTSSRSGAYRACVYLAETAAYPSRIISKTASYMVR